MSPRWAFLCTAAALSVVATPAAARVAEAPPLTIESCSIYAPVTPKWPLRRVRITVRNTAQTSADQLLVDVAKHGQLVVHGSVEPGKVSSFDVPAAAGLTGLQPHFADGMRWSMNP